MYMHFEALYSRVDELQCGVATHNGRTARVIMSGRVDAACRLLKFCYSVMVCTCVGA